MLSSLTNSLADSLSRIEISYEEGQAQNRQFFSSVEKLLLEKKELATRK